MNIAQLLLALLIFIAAVLYLVGVVWSFFGTAPEALASVISVVGAALATNFGVVLGIDIDQNLTKRASWWEKFIAFLKKIASFNLDKLPEFAALLYFIVMLIGTVVYLVSGAPATGLARELFYALVGAAVAALTHYLKK
jgi:hypothetical protein